MRTWGGRPPFSVTVAKDACFPSSLAVKGTRLLSLWGQLISALCILPGPYAHVSSLHGSMTMHFKILPHFPQDLKYLRQGREKQESLAPFLPHLEVILYMAEKLQGKAMGDKEKGNIDKCLVQSLSLEKLNKDSGPTSCFLPLRRFRGDET